VREIDGKAATPGERRDDGTRLVRPELPHAAAALAMEVTVLGRGEDVELFAAVRAVSVADEPELLEHVQRPVDGRRDRRRVDFSTAFQELAAGHVAALGGHPRQHLDEEEPLWRPA
jgi:hypothetical protein